MVRGSRQGGGARAAAATRAGGALNLSRCLHDHRHSMFPDRRGAWFATLLASSALIACAAGAAVLATQGSNNAAATVPVRVDLRPLSDDRELAPPVVDLAAAPLFTGNVDPTSPETAASGTGRTDRHGPVARAARMAVAAAGLDPFAAVDKPTVVTGAEPPLRLASLADEPPNTTTLAKRPPAVLRSREFEHAIVVAPGDTLYNILESYGVATTDAIAVARALAPEFPPQGLRAGQELLLTVRELADDEIKPLVLSLLADDRHIKVQLIEPGRYEAVATGAPVADGDHHRALASIEGSLYATARGQGVPDSIIVRMMRTHSYDVDFQREIRAGDTFEVFYTAHETEAGATARVGQVLYSSLTTSGETHSYYRFTSADGTADYYSADGMSAKKPLMRTPINGARISSSFGMRRHPILGYNRLHGGVDFAAPSGTPILAAGDGTVEVAGRNGGYGNYVRLSHKDGLATAYAHMSRFSKGIAPGKKVRQGDVIGFVGSTGASTGPHLHYEVHVGGKKENPITVKVAGGGRRLEGDELAAFEAERDRIDRLRMAAPAEALVAAAQP